MGDGYVRWDTWLRVSSLLLVRGVQDSSGSPTCDKEDTIYNQGKVKKHLRIYLMGIGVNLWNREKMIKDLKYTRTNKQTNKKHQNTNLYLGSVSIIIIA